MPPSPLPISVNLFPMRSLCIFIFLTLWGSTLTVCPWLGAQRTPVTRPKIHKILRYIMSSYSERECKRERERERGSSGYRSAAMTVRSSRRRHRGAVISSSASGHITFTLLLKIHFPGCTALRWYRLQTFRHIDYNGRDLATQTAMAAAASLCFWPGGN